MRKESELSDYTRGKVGRDRGWFSLEKREETTGLGNLHTHTPIDT